MGLSFNRQQRPPLSLVSLSGSLLDGLWKAEEVGVEAQEEEEVESGEAGRTVLHNARPGAQRQPDSKSRKIGYTVKKAYDFPVPRRGVTDQTLPGRE